MSEHSSAKSPLKGYIAVWIALLIGTGLTVYAATLDLAPYNAAVALGIANPLYDTRTFQSFDGALRGRKRNRQFVRHAFCSDEWICPQEFDHTQRIVA